MLVIYHNLLPSCEPSHTLPIANKKGAIGTSHPDRTKLHGFPSADWWQHEAFNSCDQLPNWIETFGEKDDILDSANPGVATR